MSYTWKLEIGLLVGGAVSFSGDTPRQRDLGGAEYCAVMLAEALTKLGHRVTVFTPDSPQVYGLQDHLTCQGVYYYPRERTFREVCRATQWDVFICSRDYAALSSTLIQSKMLVLWNHDILTDPDSFREHIGRADKIYCLSDYHKSQFLNALATRGTQDATLKPEHITVTRNGVDTQLIEEVLTALKAQDTSVKALYPTFIYTSRPERGLKYLLRDIWPGILKILPDARLKVACYDVDAEQLPERIAQIHRECYTLIKQYPSVEFLGSLRRRDLFVEVAQAHALLYPSIFPEVSCLSVLEAQALGTPALTSKRGALAESNWSVTHQIFADELVEEGVYGASDYNALAYQWIKTFYDEYHDPFTTRERLQRQKNVQHYYAWDLIAQEWEVDFYAHFYARSHTYTKRVIENLLYHSDILAAEWVLKQYLFPVMSPSQQDKDIPYSEWEPIRNQVENHLKYHHVEPEQYAGHETSESLHILPDRMKIALEMIEHAYGHDTPFRLLDVGMGSGRFLYHVLKHFHNCQVMGMDFSEKLCDQATTDLLAAFPATLGGLPFIVQCDPLELDVEEFFAIAPKPDVVVAAEWLEHQADLEKALYVVHRMCKDGGMVIYTTPYGPWEAISFGEAKTAEGEEIRFHVSHFEHQDFQEMFQEVAYTLEASYTQLSPIDMATLGNFILSYRKPTHPVRFYTPNYERKFLTTRPYTRIAGFLITKNEEDNMTRALKPLQKRFDKLLVYDTGSSDATSALAEKYALVVHGYWDQDFAAARNRAMDIVRALEEFDADWVYWQDADEVLLGGHKLRFYLQGDLRIYTGLIITQNHLMIDNPMTVDIPVRIFRNSLDYKFMGCVTGDTLIDCPRDLQAYPDGIPIKDLVGKKDFYTYVYSRKYKRFKLRQVEWVKKTRKHAPIKRVVWRDGYSGKMGELKLTKDHLVLLWNGEWKQAGDLQPGDRLRPFRRGYHRRKPYADIMVAHGEYEAEHRFIYREMTRRPLPKGYHVHHEDGNGLNNTPDNLILMSAFEHLSQHHKGKLVSLKTRYRISQNHHDTSGKNNPNYGKKHSAETLAKIGAKSAERWKNPDFKEHMHTALSLGHQRGKEEREGNHLVVSVEDFGYEDVYNMEVRGIHNFVANEIVVHNCIHEHILDSRDPDGNTNLTPLLILPDVKIAHYGYVTEEERRWKARHRNWDILKQDLRDNPKRELTTIFLMRDYVQHVRWHLERSQTLTAEHVSLLHQVITLYEPFRDHTSHNHILARVFYQDALRLLGEHHLPTAAGTTPIQAAIVLAAKRGPFPTGEEFTPELRWFLGPTELEQYVLRHLNDASEFVRRRPRLFDDGL